MTKEEQLRYEFFIETGVLWIDTNNKIEMEYLEWVEKKALSLCNIAGRCDICQSSKDIQTYCGNCMEERR